MSKAIVFAHRQEPSVERGLGVQPLTKERGRSHDQSLGCSRHPRVVSSRGARDRVGNFGILCDLPGDRHGGAAAAALANSRVGHSVDCCAYPLTATAKGGLGPLSVPILALRVRCARRPTAGVGPDSAESPAVEGASIAVRSATIRPRSIPRGSATCSAGRSLSNCSTASSSSIRRCDTPALAQFWKASRDGLTWTFTLKKGVKFHHGREVTAEDVVYSLTRVVDPKMKSGSADLFARSGGARSSEKGRRTSVRPDASDRYTVQVGSTRPWRRSFRSWQ